MTRPTDHQNGASVRGADRTSIDGFTAPHSPLKSDTQRGLGAPNPPLDWRNPRMFGHNVGQLVKQFIPRSLLPRALLIFMVPVIILQAVLAYVFYDRYWELVTSRFGLALTGEISAVIDLYNQNQRDGLTDEGLQDVVTFASRHFSLHLTINYNSQLPEPEEVAAKDYDNFHRIIRNELGHRLPYPTWLDLDATPDEGNIQIALPDQYSAPGTATVLSFMVPIKRLSTATGYIVLLWMIGLSALLSVIAILFLRNQIRPISQLADAAEKFGRGIDPVGFKPTGAAEVRTAARAFIRMRQRIERQINQRTEMLAGISHDLRTPLTRLRLELSMLPQDENVAHMRADLDDMQVMLQDYLEFAKGQSEAESERTNIATLLNELMARLTKAGKPVSLIAASDAENVTLSCRPVQLRRAIENLINNGCQHGTSVEVHLQKLSNHLEVRIEDDGPGIPEDRYEEALRPFSRLDSARNQDSDNRGSGLGLAVARDIARAHGGDLILNKSNRGGLRATIRLPLGKSTIQSN